MRDVGARKEMLAQLEAYKRSPRPEGAGAHRMTDDEMAGLEDTVKRVYASAQQMDNCPDDRDLRKGQVDLHVSTRDNRFFDAIPEVATNTVRASYGGRSKTIELVQDMGVERPGDPAFSGVSVTDMLFAEQNITFTTGVILHRDHDTVSGTKFYIDRRNPAASLIQEFSGNAQE